MQVHPFRLAAVPATPWRNGGGTTREIVSLPAGASLDAAVWRVSVATIAADGPFSLFPGVDRTIMLLEGDGVRLHSPDQTAGIDQSLTEPLVPFQFPGDVPIECTLLGGESMDLNVMARRGQGASTLTVRRADLTVSAETGLLLSVGDDAEVTGDTSKALPHGEGLWWDGPATFAVRVRPGGAVAVVTWQPSAS